MAPDEALLVEGDLVAGKYRVRELFARGGMGQLYTAEQLPLGRQVALKVLDPAFSNEARQRFLREAAALATIRHPNTVTVFDYGRAAVGRFDLTFMVMEFVEGRTLSAVLAEEGVFGPGRALHIVTQVARAIREAHAMGIVHRDLKPSNLMLADASEGETVKVLDFGIAKRLDENTLTRDGDVLGSPYYMAPEQVAGGAIDERTDIYALGVLLFNMLSGDLPFGSSIPMEAVLGQLEHPEPSLAAYDVPESLDALVKRCMARDPAARFATIDELTAEIRRVLRTLPVSEAISASDAGLSGALRPSLVAHLQQTQRFYNSRFLLAPAALALVALTTMVVLWAQSAFSARAPGESGTVSAAPPEVLLRSTPEAEVYVEGRLVGHTPMQLVLEGPTTFELRASGFAPVRIEQPSSSRDVVHHVHFERAAPESADRL